MSSRGAFSEGVRAGLPFVLIVGPFGLVFGVVATDAGLDILQTLAFSVTVFAGAAQLTAVQLMTENAPVFVILVTALAVNLRMAMYSASLAPHIGKAPVWQRALAAYLMVDQAYAISHLDYENRPDRPLPDKMAFYFGAIAPIAPMWFLGTLAGAMLGNRIPPSMPIGLAVPIAFLALVGPMLRTLAHVAAAFVSVAGTLLLAFLPYDLGLLIAAVAALIAGAMVETWTTRREAAP
ncbi:MAG: AzlC family ABC transporter permease [Pararhodobacter sp.]